MNIPGRGSPGVTGVVQYRPLDSLSETVADALPPIGCPKFLSENYCRFTDIIVSRDQLAVDQGRPRKLQYAEQVVTRTTVLSVHARFPEAVIHITQYSAYFQRLGSTFIQLP